MVNDITTIGKLLELPDLEDDTKATINSAVRELVHRYMNYKPPEELSPEEHAKRILGEGTFQEWVGGPKGGDT